MGPEHSLVFRRCRRCFDAGEVLGRATTNLVDAYPVRDAALEDPALVGMTQIVAAIARALAGQIEIGERRTERVVADEPAVAFARRRAYDAERDDAAVL